MWLDWLVSCECGFQSVYPLMEKDKKLMEACRWERLRGNLGLVLMGRAMLSKSLIQFSVDGRGCIPSLCYLTWGQTMVEVMKIMATASKGSMQALLHSVPQTLQQATATHTSPRDCWTLMGKSGSVSCGVTAPFSWVLVHIRFCLCPPRVCFPSPV